MKRGILVAAVAFVTACGGGEKTPLEKGRIDYLRVCSTCHGPAGQGAGRLGNPINDTEYMRATSNEELVEFLKVGRMPSDAANRSGMLMPPRGGDPRITDQDLENIVLFVRTFGSGD